MRATKRFLLACLATASLLLAGCTSPDDAAPAPPRVATSLLFAVVNATSSNLDADLGNEVELRVTVINADGLAAACACDVELQLARADARTSSPDVDPVTVGRLRAEPSGFEREGGPVLIYRVDDSTLDDVLGADGCAFTRAAPMAALVTVTMGNETVRDSAWFTHECAPAPA